MSRRVTYFNSSFATSFHPIDLAGTQLYFAKNTATPSLWNDQSPNGYDVSQGTAGKQPTIGVDTVDFNGVDDLLNRDGVFFNTDTEGIIYFSGIVTSGVNTFLGFTTALHTANANFIYIACNSDKVTLFVRKNDFTINNVISTVDTFGSGYIYGYVKASGGSYEIYVNGSIRAFTFTGLDDGSWYSSIDSCTRLSIGALNRFSLVYRLSKVNKSYYNNQPSLLSPTDIAKLNTFFSDPNNY